MEASLNSLKEDEKFQVAIDYVSEESSDLAFTAVSLREKLDDEILGKLSPVAAALTSLDLAGAAVSEAEVIEQLSKMPNLLKLDLKETELGDAVLDAVANLEQLEFLNLFDTRVTDAGLMKLKPLGNLKKIFLGRTDVTAEGADELKNALPGLEVNLGVN